MTPEQRTFLAGLTARFAENGSAPDPAEAFRRTLVGRAWLEKTWSLFGKELMGIVEELNGELVA